MGETMRQRSKSRSPSVIIFNNIHEMVKKSDGNSLESCEKEEASKEINDTKKKHKKRNDSCSSSESTHKKEKTKEKEKERRKEKERQHSDSSRSPSHRKDKSRDRSKRKKH